MREVGERFAQTSRAAAASGGAQLLQKFLTSG